MCNSVKYGKKKPCNKGDECMYAHHKDEFRGDNVSIEDYLRDHRKRNPHLEFFIPKKIKDKFASAAKGDGLDTSQLSSNSHLSGMGRG